MMDYFCWWPVAKACSASTVAIRRVSPCAGTAAIFALKTGLVDCQEIISSSRILTHDELKNINTTFDAESQRCVANGWLGSVNAGLYGGDFAPYRKAAALATGIYAGIAPDSTILQSQSLMREAANKPISMKLAS